MVIAQAYWLIPVGCMENALLGYEVVLVSSARLVDGNNSVSGFREPPYTKFTADY
jgi:hypothetical protein